MPDITDEPYLQEMRDLRRSCHDLHVHSPHPTKPPASAESCMHVASVASPAWNAEPHPIVAHLLMHGRHQRILRV